MVGASQKIVTLNRKKQIDAESVAFNFRTKKVSVYGIEDEITKEIYKFPYPMQLMIVKEASTVMERLVEGKSTQGLLLLIVAACSVIIICCYANIYFTNISMVLADY